MDILSTLLLALVIALLIYLKWKNKPMNLPPGPTALPLVGNIHTMDGHAPFKTFLKVSQLFAEAFLTYRYSVEIGECRIRLYIILLQSSAGGIMSLDLNVKM